jgi:cyclopropane-fatty-acyl-phospholipid synthase
MRILARAAERAVHARLEAITEGRLVLHHGGTTTVFGTGAGPTAAVTVRSPAMFAAVALEGHLGAARSYVRGEWEADDLTAVVRLLARNRAAFGRLEGGSARVLEPFRRLLHAARRNTRSGSRRNVRAHYDLGNEFFARFLDDTLTYSAGLFDGPGTSLHAAQRAKYERLCRKLDLASTDRLVEVGSGWGGFALHAAGRYGCSVTGTTISREQHRLAQERVSAAGLGDRVRILDRDYRELEGRFDKLVSIEMVEAVGHQYYREYFARCAELLEPHGLAAIQAITIQDHLYAPAEPDFIKRHVFPGTSIPSVSALVSAAAPTDLRLVHLEDLTPHYAETLRRWRERFEAAWPEIERLGFDERFRRLWRFYLCYCEGGFAERILGSVQLLFAKPRASVPSPLAFEATAQRVEERPA